MVTVSRATLRVPVRAAVVVFAETVYVAVSVSDSRTEITASAGRSLAFSTPSSSSRAEPA